MAEIIKKEDKEIFINTLNKKGFLLEDRTWVVLNSIEGWSTMKRNKVIQYPYQDDRVEIDFIFIHENRHFLVECKRTDYSWFFPRALERSNTITLILDSPEGIKTNTRYVTKLKTAWYDVAVEFDEDGKLRRPNRNSDTAQLSFKDVHKAFRQSLKETEAYISTNEYLSIRVVPFNNIIIPIVVTNAKLFFLNYSKVDIDKNGDLINYGDIEEVGYIAYNFPQVLRWGGMGNQIVYHTSGSQDHVKTIFFVNINYLAEFIKNKLYNG